MNDRQKLGRLGEELACEILSQAGLEIVERNYRCPKGEVDIIAKAKDTLIFVEVRTRSSNYRGWGEESITASKVRRLQAIAGYYIVSQGFKSWPSLRFDVIAIRRQGERMDHNWVKAIT